jgi:hypothetical protein
MSKKYPVMDQIYFSLVSRKIRVNQKFQFKENLIYINDKYPGNWRIPHQMLRFPRLTQMHTVQMRYNLGNSVPNG